MSNEISVVTCSRRTNSHCHQAV